MSEGKNEILETRIGGLGSSDAKIKLVETV